MSNRQEVISLDRYSEATKRYRHAYLVPFHSADGETAQDVEENLKTGILVQFEPKDRADAHRRFMRFECNPTRIPHGRGILGMIAPLLETVLPAFDVSEFMVQIYFSTLHLTFDVNVDIENIAVSYILGKPTISEYFRHNERRPKGRLDGMYIGAYSGDRTLCLYDKREEERKRQTRQFKTVVGRGGYTYVTYRAPRWPTTRFELRLRKCGSLPQLQMKRNIFEKYLVRLYDTVALKLPDHISVFFLDACKQRGLQGALSLIKNKTRQAAYRNAVRESEQPKWWNAEELWAEVRPAITGAFFGTS